MRCCAHIFINRVHFRESSFSFPILAFPFIPSSNTRFKYHTFLISRRFHHEWCNPTSSHTRIYLDLISTSKLPLTMMHQQVCFSAPQPQISSVQQPKGRHFQKLCKTREEIIWHCRNYNNMSLDTAFSSDRLINDELVHSAHTG